MSAFADYIFVLSKGKIVETGAAQEIMESPEHAYTKTLISAM